MHGSGDAQDILADTELYALICIAIGDLGWSFQELGIESIELPNTDYYQINLTWFNQVDIAELNPDKIIAALDSCIKKDNDFFFTSIIFRLCIAEGLNTKEFYLNSPCLV
jgi:hypothetical protein